MILIQHNGQLLAVPVTQFNGSNSGLGANAIKIPPRASSAPPTKLEMSWPHPTRPASVDAVGILKGSASNSLRASPKSITPPSQTPPIPATPPMPTLEPNESLSIRASIDSSEAEIPDLTEEINGVDENMKPGPSPMTFVQAEQNGSTLGQAKVVRKTVVVSTGSASSTISQALPTLSVAASAGAGTKVLVKSYGVPLLPKPPSAPELAQNPLACNVKALVVCKQCGKFCHNDCISSSNVCVSCLIR